MIRCPNCQTPNQSHHRFCLSCGQGLIEMHATAATVTATPKKSPSIPLQRPRKILSHKFYKAHSFGLMFGGIWAFVGGLLFGVFTAIAIAMPAMILGSLIASPFLFVGTGILLTALFRVMHKKHLARHGAQVKGHVVSSEIDSTYRVNQQSSTRITYAYTDSHGNEHTNYVQSFDHGAISTHPPGTEITLLHDPSWPSDFMAPTIHGVQFEPAEGVDDQRPERIEQGEASEPAQVAFEAPLTTEVDPMPVPFWMALMRRGRRTLAGTIGLSDGALTQTIEGEPAPRRVKLDEPFVAHATTWPVSATETEVVLTLRQRGAPAFDPGVKLMTRLAQSRVSARVDLQQDTAHCLKPEDFDRLWSQIRAFASLQGTDLPEIADTGVKWTLPDPQKRVQAVEQVEVSARGQS